MTTLRNLLLPLFTAVVEFHRELNRGLHVMHSSETTNRHVPCTGAHAPCPAPRTTRRGGGAPPATA